MTTLTSVTRREAKEAVDTFIRDYIAGSSSNSPESIDSIITALTSESDMQVRDYCLGLTLDHPVSTLTEAFSVLSAFIPEGKKAGIYSILATYSYTQDEAINAFEFLSLALADDAEYSLANLLTRVFRAGWTVESFKEMTRELHPKVLAELDDTIIE